MAEFDSRAFIARLPLEVTRRDIEKFFENEGFKIYSIELKNRFAFVDLESPSEVDRAIRELDRGRILGKPVVVDKYRSKRDRSNESRHNDRISDRARRDDIERDRKNASKYQVQIENLSTNIQWQQLKKLFQDYAPTYVNAHKKENGLGVLFFETHGDLSKAMQEFNEKEIDGKRIHLKEIDISTRRFSRSRSRSRNRLRCLTRSRSRSPLRRSRKHSSTSTRTYSVSPYRGPYSYSPISRRNSRNYSISPMRDSSQSPSLRHREVAGILKSEF